jgi:hypothetical protein
MQPAAGPLPPDTLPAVKSRPADPGNVLGFLPLRDLFSLDLRSLAVLRIGLGLLLLIDWIDRLPDLRAHYSDAGIVPRDAITGLQPISLHLYHGGAWFQGLLAAVALVFAVLLLVGWRTPFVTLVSWFLLISVHARCPAVLQGGDQLLRLLLFWGIFLPLGACYSLDSSRPEAAPEQEGKNRNRVLSPASVAYIIQLCLVYWYASAWKWAPEWRTDGTAVYLALQADYFATRFAHFLLGYPEVLRWLTFGALWLETLGPAVLFLPFAPALQRLLVISAFLFFHVGLAISLELGNFPWVCCVAWLAILPTAFWDRLGRQLRDPEVAGLALVPDPHHARAPARLSVLRTFLVLGEARLGPPPEAPDLPRLRAEGWGLVDSRGDWRFGYDALVLLVRLSPVFAPAAALVRFRPVRWLAERWARFTAGPLTGPRALPQAAAPPWTPPNGLIANTLVLFFLVYVILWNVRSFGMGTADWFSRPGDPAEDKYEWVFPSPVSYLGSVLGLEQGWGLFAPRPGTDVGWHLAVGILKDGSTIDLLNGGAPLDPQRLTDYRPKMLAASYSNGRWRKLMMNLPAYLSYPYLAQGFALYQFREWNATHSPDEQLEAVDILYVKEVSSPPGQDPPPVGAHLLYHYEPGAPAAQPSETKKAKK